MSSIDSYFFHALDAEADRRRRDSLESNQRPDDTIMLPVLIRVTDPSWKAINIPDLQITSRLGSIIACRGTRRALETLSRDSQVLTIEASRRGTEPSCHQSVPFIKADVVHAKPSAAEKGERAIVAVIDTGIDVLHEAFRDAAGTGTRLLAFWDQSDKTGSGDGKMALYGRVYKATDLAGFVSSGQISPMLDRDTDTGHGTHVTSIAAGKSGTHFFGGVAPEAKIVVVKTDQGRHSLGYSQAHVDALAFIDALADEYDLPVVVNLSQGMNAGAHDGTSLLESAFDEFSAGGRKPGRVIVKSAGNERQKGGHAKLQIISSSFETLTWRSARDHEEDRLELWFKATDEFRFRLVNPDGEVSDWVSWQNVSLQDVFFSGNKYRISYDRFHGDNGDSRLLITIMAGSAMSIPRSAQPWKLEVESGQVRSPGVIHAWIERDRTQSISFTSHFDEQMTLSIPGTAHTVITVGCVESQHPYRVPPYASFGPTRDGRFKPDLSAPGHQINAARAGTLDQVESMSGTSMAAAHVSGAIALLFSHWAKAFPGKDQLNAAQVRAAISSMTQAYNGHWSPGMGFGVLDVEQLIDIFK